MLGDVNGGVHKQSELSVVGLGGAKIGALGARVNDAGRGSWRVLLA